MFIKNSRTSKKESENNNIETPHSRNSTEDVQIENMERPNVVGLTNERR